MHGGVRTFALAAASCAAAADARALFAAACVALTTAGLMDGFLVGVAVGADVLLVGALRTADRRSLGVSVLTACQQQRQKLSDLPRLKTNFTRLKAKPWQKEAWHCGFLSLSAGRVHDLSARSSSICAHVHEARMQGLRLCTKSALHEDACMCYLEPQCSLYSCTPQTHRARRDLLCS